MNILLDYLFPITTIEPTPAASTAFLKQVLVVAKPKDGGVTAGVITLCTSMTAVNTKFGTGAAAEVQKLFDAGMSRVYVLPNNDLGIATILEGHEADFFTILVSSDFSDDEIGNSNGETVAEVKASIKIQDILFTAKTAGVAGNSITVNYNTGGTAGSESVSVVGSAITVAMEDGVSTATQLKTAIDNSVPAAALVDLVVDSGDETDKQAVFGAAVSLTGGVDGVSGDGLDVGAFEGVVGVSSTDDDFLADQAAISARAAFHTTSVNKAKNMFYAFGKLLSNPLNWRNQQYISMPLADDVATLGDANNLFDNKISFVISDDQYSNRLSLFAAGGKAIVAPYIKRNLQIDMQSKALQYIAGNQPAYTKVQASLLQDELEKVIASYVATQWITEGVVDVALTADNFVASGNINIAEPKALWRIFAEMRQSL